MLCKECGYRLWNLPSRTCPECGTPFLPSEFEFVVNSIRFSCPHCNQSYYGTGTKGHLIPISFGCTSCGRHIHMDEMILSPTAGVDETLTRVDRVPWLERKERGIVKAWFSTIGMALVHPQRLTRAIPDSGSAADAWTFAVVTNMLIFCCSMIPLVLLPAIVSGNVGFLCGLIAVALVSAVIVILVIAIWGGVTHGMLRLTGPIEHTIDRTYQAICYGTGANVFSAVPCLGFYVGWIWCLFSSILMVQTAQGVRGWRATLAVLILPSAVFLLGAGLYASLLAGLLAGTGPFAKLSNISPYTDTSIVVQGVLAFAAKHQGQGPRHAIQLVVGEQLRPTDLLASDFATQLADVPLGNSTLDQYVLMNDIAAATLVAAEIKSMDKKTIAHRLGDYVFVHHGIKFTNCDPRLWIVVLSPDPDVNGKPIPGERVNVGLCDGTVTIISADKFAASLEEQNRFRSKRKLSPLPDPRTVKHGQPILDDT